MSIVRSGDAWTDSMSERQLQDAIIGDAKQLGWMCYHQWRSDHSPSGFPDLFCIHPATGRRLALEIKSAKGKVSVEQAQWLSALALSGIPAAVVRPCDRDQVREWLR